MAGESSAGGCLSPIGGGLQHFFPKVPLQRTESDHCDTTVC